MIRISKLDNLSGVPETWGIYVLWEDSRIYCGVSENLRRRIPESRSEQGFGEAVLTFMGGAVCKPKEKAGWEDLERCCIGALHTIVWGNGLPIELSNQAHVLLLPEIVWTSHEYTLDHLAIEIAQEVLYQMGVPSYLTALPDYRNLFFPTLPRVAAQNRKNWKEILEEEHLARRG